MLALAALAGASVLGCSGAHFAELAQGGSVVVTSSDGAAHAHAVTVTCA